MSASGQFRRLGEVGDWSAYPSIAAELTRCSEPTECARRDPRNAPVPMAGLGRNRNGRFRVRSGDKETFVYRDCRHEASAPYGRYREESADTRLSC